MDAALVLQRCVYQVCDVTLDHQGSFLFEEAYKGLVEVNAPFQEPLLVVVLGKPEDIGILGAVNKGEPLVVETRY